MIRRLRITNFKCFQDTGELNIRPLTFLVGPNSAGKSSVLQFLLMLRQTVDSTDPDNPLVTNGGWVEMGAFPEFIFRREYKRQLGVDLDLATEHLRPAQRTIDGMEAPVTRIQAKFGYNKKTTQIRLAKSEVSQGGTSYKVEASEKTKKYVLTRVSSNRETPVVILDNVLPASFYDYRFVIRRGRPRPTAKASMGDTDFYLLPHLIRRAFNRLFYIGPLREYPKRIYVTSGQSPRDVGTRGEKASDVLWIAHRSASKKIRAMEADTRRWLRDFGIASHLELRRLGAGNYYQIVVTDPHTGTEVALPDVGFGASQLLPIILESLYAPAGSAIAIEQPEIHLHPKAQAILGDLLIEAAQKSKHTLIIETHSEQLLARIRRRIAEGTVRAESVAIYFFEPTKEGTTIRTITVNSQGQFENFPPGFFEEDLDEALAHAKALTDGG